MPDTTLPINEATAPEQFATIGETPETPTALETQETPETIVETPLEAEIEEELIIEDFTIDGICGAY